LTRPSVVRLTIVRDEIEAEILCGLLRSSGIECAFRRTDVAAGAWEGTGVAGPTEVLVGARDLAAARALLEQPGV
jgi:hypothetical protein